MNHAVIQLLGICNLVPYHFFHRQQLLQLVVSLRSVQRTISMHITTRVLIQHNSWGKSTINSSCRRAGRQKAESAGPTSYYPKTALFLPHQYALHFLIFTTTFWNHPTPLNSSHSPPPVTAHQPPRPKSLTSRPQHPRHVWPRHLRRCRSYPKQLGPNVAHLRLGKNDTRPEFSQKRKENFSLLKSGSQKRVGNTLFNHLNWKLNNICIIRTVYTPSNHLAVRCQEFQRFPLLIWCLPRFVANLSTTTNLCPYKGLCGY